MIECFLCGKEVKKRGLGNHLVKQHFCCLYEPKRCKICGEIVTKGSKNGFCNSCRPRSGKNNPMYGKSVKDVWIEKYGKEETEIKHKERITKTSNILKEKWKDISYRDKVIKAVSKPRSEEGKKNISIGVKKSYNEKLRNDRRNCMLQRIDNGFDPGKERFLSGEEGWGKNFIVNGIRCVSTLEMKRVCWLLDNGFYVENFEERPIRYNCSKSLLEKRYFPDFIIEDGKYIEEIKYSHQITRIVKDKYVAAYNYYKKIGCLYYIVTEKDFEKDMLFLFNNYTNTLLREELRLL